MRSFNEEVLNCINRITLAIVFDRLRAMRSEENIYILRPTKFVRVITRHERSDSNNHVSVNAAACIQH